MRRTLTSVVSIAGVAVATTLSLGVAPVSAASGPCIKVGHTCYGSLPAALAAAHDGDVVRLPAGTFRGGVTITTSIRLVGAGAGRTVIRGGEHVLTIGTYLDDTPPTVTVKGVTITGGHARSAPYSEEFTGVPGAIAAGAGIEVSPGADFGHGATVRLVGVLVTGNRAEPRAQLHRDWGDDGPICPFGPCPFAGANGGGIDNWGDLTLVRSRVSGNTVAGHLTSDADGGGIMSWNGLTLKHSTVTRNRAVAVAPYGRYVEGGGIYMQFETNLVMHGSSVSGNTAKLTSHNPVTNPDGSTTDMLVNSGGIHVSDGSTVTIAHSHIDHNLAAIKNLPGSGGVQMSGMQLGYSHLTLTDTTMNYNRQTSRIKTSVDWAPGGVMGWCLDGTIRGLSVIGNSTTITALHGDAATMPAVQAFGRECENSEPFTMSDSVISKNTTRARAPHGVVYLWGVGLYVDAKLTLRHVAVTGNKGLGYGQAGEAKGGGIWNGGFPFLDEMNSELALDHVLVTGNSVRGTRAMTVAGGGIYTVDPITFHSTRVWGNHPDQCFGCDAPATSSSLAVPRSTGLQQRGLAHARTSPLGERLSN